MITPQQFTNLMLLIIAAASVIALIWGWDLSAA